MMCWVRGISTRWEKEKKKGALSFWCFWPMPIRCRTRKKFWLYIKPHQKPQWLTVSLKLANHINLLYIAEAAKTLVLPQRASSQPTVKPNICLPPVAALEESPWPKTKRGTFLFVWVSCSAVVSSTLVMIGLVGCFSPSQAKDWSWLMGWFVQSLLGFW